MIRAVIFDMDGTLLDSEPLWGLAEEEIYPGLGIPYSHDFADQITGLRTDEAVRFWYDRYPWEEPDIENVVEMFRVSMESKLRDQAPVMPGALELIEQCEKLGIRMAVASSSAKRLMIAGLERFGLERFAVIHSAESEEFGKPHPAVYLSTLSELCINADECIAFEDSINGMRSALNAGIFTVAVPSPADFASPVFNEADIKLKSLEDFDIEPIINENVTRRPARNLSESRDV